MKRHLLMAIIFSVILAATPALSGHAWAQQLDLEVENPAEVQAAGQTAVYVGLGPGIAPDYEGSSHYQAVPIPFVSVKFSNDMSIQWIANLARADLIPDRTWMGGPIIQYIQKRDNVDNNRVDKLDTVDASLMAGGFFGIRTGRLYGSEGAIKYRSTTSGIRRSTPLRPGPARITWMRISGSIKAMPIKAD
jgi:outer membrane scaffolding protein for murein synthesis (MipA/OmpV family)